MTGIQKVCVVFCNLFGRATIILKFLVKNINLKKKIIPSNRKFASVYPL
jgi:hypothetical protein